MCCLLPLGNPWDLRSVSRELTRVVCRVQEELVRTKSGKDGERKSVSKQGAIMFSALSSTTLHGSCHCGRLRIEFSTDKATADFTPRACDCSFCRKHGAAYVSDPEARLLVSIRQDALRRYRQGSDNAEFLVCGECGVMVAVTFDHAGRLYGAVNTGCLDTTAGFKTAAAASPQLLSAEQKISRWLALWIPDVHLAVEDD